MRYLNTLLSAAATFAPLARALNNIEVQDQEFVDPTSGKRFEIIGVDYQPGGSSGYNPASGTDALTNPSACLRDAALMQQLGINTIRVYNLDPYLDHNQCASIFNMAGIYMIIDVNSPLPNESIDANSPDTTYDSVYLNRTFAILDAFRGYDNTLGFFSANELIQTPTQAQECPPYIRAVTRDLKQYLQARGGRQIPVGYSAADYRDVLVDTANYVSCTINGDSTDDNISSGRSDFFGLNSYSWCGDATFESSTYNQLAADFANTTMPVFFSEYGCNQVEPRTFTEVAALYGSDMITWSGGLVYEWTQDTNNFGLVQINSDGSVSILIDYDNLQSQFNALDLSIIESKNSSATSLDLTACDASIINGDIFLKTFDIPSAPPGASSLIASGAPGASVGSLVSVTQTVVTVAITAYDGSVTSSMSITSASSANVPGGATGTASTVSGASATGTSSSSTGGAAPRVTGVNAAALGAAGLMLFALA